MEQSRLIPQSIIEAVLEDVVSSEFERDLAITRLRHMSAEFATFGGGVRSDL